MSKSLTAQLNKKRLQDTLRRRRVARTMTHLFDHSVPTDLRFHGVILKKNHATKPSVRVAEAHARSPYIIHLNAHLPRPHELVDDHAVSAPNLLVPEHVLVSLEQAAAMNPEHDLVLFPTDIAGQVLEDVERPEAAETAEETKVERNALAFFDHPETIRSHFSVKPFVPPQAPANYAAFFEMPEEDTVEGVEEDDEVILELPSFAKTEQPSVTQPLNDSTTFSLRFLPVGWHRAIGAFVLVAIVFVLPLHAVSFAMGLTRAKTGLETASASAIDNLKAGASAALVRDASAASVSFGKADEAFSKAQSTVNDLGTLTGALLAVMPATGSSYRNGTALLEAGKSLSSAGERISQGVLAAQDELSPTPTSRLKLLATYISSALPDLTHASELIAEVEPSAVPAAQRGTFEDLAERLPKLVATVDQFLQFSDMLQTLLGAGGTKHYVVVFQNNTELRATGGFMGSYAEIDVKDGEIVKMDVPGGGTYDLQGSLKTNVAAPEPLQLLSARWEFQDANWFPDFPTSARKIMGFYADAEGGSVDGVISVNATFVADFIGLLGPVDMPDYGRTITSDNFLAETQKIVENEYDREENKPKAFIGDLAPIVLDRVMHGTPENFFAALDRVNEGLGTRDIQVYFADGDLEREVRELGWGGELKAADGDYAMLVNTNLGGGKTDGVISETMDVSASIAEDGSVTDTVTVTRTHHGIAGDAFTGVNNVDYVRLYVPQGATLIDSSGFTIPDPALFDIAPSDWKVDDDLLYSFDTLQTDAVTGTATYNESGKTVFGNWVQTKPGQTSTFTFRYRLPFTVAAKPDSELMAFAKKTLGIPTTESYSLAVQKQSGVLDRSTHVTVGVPANRNVVWSSHDLAGTTFGSATDAFVGALFEKN